MEILITLVNFALIFIQLVFANSSDIVIWRPNANITRFEATLIIPPATNAASSGSQQVIQELWGAGLAQVGGDDLWVNEVTNQYGTGTWTLQSTLLSHGQHNPLNVYPGQALTTIFTNDITNGVWMNTWVVESGTAPNVASYSGSFQEDPAKTNENHAYIGAILGGTFNGAGNDPATVWDFGNVNYQNIIITAETTSTSWCTPTKVGASGGWTAPVAQLDVSGKYMTCYIAQLFIVNPGTPGGQLQHFPLTSLLGN